MALRWYNGGSGGKDNGELSLKLRMQT